MQDLPDADRWVEFEGVCHPSGMTDTSDSFHLSEKEIALHAKHVAGKPILHAHESDPIGKIVSGRVGECGGLIVHGRIDRLAPGAASVVSAMQSGSLSGLSMGLDNMILSGPGVPPFVFAKHTSEISVVKKGDRPGTHVTKVSPNSERWDLTRAIILSGAQSAFLQDQIAAEQTALTSALRQTTVDLPRTAEQLQERMATQEQIAAAAQAAQLAASIAASSPAGAGAGAPSPAITAPGSSITVPPAVASPSPAVTPAAAAAAAAAVAATTGEESAPAAAAAAATTETSEVAALKEELANQKASLQALQEVLAGSKNIAAMVRDNPEQLAGFMRKQDALIEDTKRSMAAKEEEIVAHLVTGYAARGEAVDAGVIDYVREGCKGKNAVMFAPVAHAITTVAGAEALNRASAAEAALATMKQTHAAEEAKWIEERTRLEAAHREAGYQDMVGQKRHKPDDQSSAFMFGLGGQRQPPAGAAGAAGASGAGNSAAAAAAAAAAGSSAVGSDQDASASYAQFGDAPNGLTGGDPSARVDQGLMSLLKLSARNSYAHAPPTLGPLALLYKGVVGSADDLPAQ